MKPGVLRNSILGGSRRLVMRNHEYLVLIRPGLEAARGRALHQSLVSGIKAKFVDKISDVKEHWSGNNGGFAFVAMGFDISGTVQVDEREVCIQPNLPTCRHAV